MSKAMLAVFVYHAVPMFALYIVFGDYIHFGRNYLIIPDEIREDMASRAQKRGMTYISFARKILRTACFFERIEDSPKMKILIEEEGTKPTRFQF